MIATKLNTSVFLFGALFSSDAYLELVAWFLLPYMCSWSIRKTWAAAHWTCNARWLTIHMSARWVKRCACKFLHVQSNGECYVWSTLCNMAAVAPCVPNRQELLTQPAAQYQHARLSWRALNADHANGYGWYVLQRLISHFKLLEHSLPVWCAHITQCDSNSFRWVSRNVIAVVSSFRLPWFFAPCRLVLYV